MCDEKIKIIHVAQANGGVERYLKMFFKYSKNQYENYLIASNQYESSKAEFEKLGVKVFFVDMIREINFIKDIKAMYDIYKIINLIKPNFVYSHSSKAGGLARIPARIVGSMNIYNPHGWAFDMNLSYKKKRVYILIEKMLALITNKIIAISPYEEKVALENKIAKPSKIAIIENGIDLEYDKRNKEVVLKEIGWSESDIVIGMVARISEQKSPKTFVGIAEKISNIIPNSKFIIVGNGDQRNDIEKLIKEKNLQDSFYITGWIDNPQDYIQIFNFALLTSKWEGFGLVIPEYMVAKKVVIASNIGGISYIIQDRKTGFLVEDLKIEKFIDRIIELFENSNLKKKIESEAYNLAINKYDFKRVIYEHNLIFESIVES